MKKNILFTCIMSLFLISCEDVIEVDLEEKEPKLVIEATGIQQENAEEGFMEVKLTTTNPFFDDITPQVTNAQVSILLNQEEYVLENQNSSSYTNVIPMVENSTYKLKVVYNQEVYEAQTQLYKTVPFDFVEQDNNGFNPDEIAINAYFTDPPELGNNYFFYFITSRFGTVRDTSDDELINGNQVSTFYTEEFDTSDVVNISIQGVSDRFNTYISTLLEQANDSGSPFSTASSTIRGNIINTTNPNNFPLGYFRISQQYQTTYTVQ